MRRSRISKGTLIVNLILEESQQQSEAYSAQIQELFDKLAAEEHVTKEVEPSIDFLTLDEERQRLQKRGKELEEDRRRFTEAAVRLGKEKASLEVVDFSYSLYPLLITYASRLKE